MQLPQGASSAAGPRRGRGSERPAGRLAPWAAGATLAAATVAMSLVVGASLRFALLASLLAFTAATDFGFAVANSWRRWLGAKVVFAGSVAALAVAGLRIGPAGLAVGFVAHGA